MLQSLGFLYLALATERPRDWGRSMRVSLLRSRHASHVRRRGRPMAARPIVLGAEALRQRPRPNPQPACRRPRSACPIAGRAPQTPHSSPAGLIFARPCQLTFSAACYVVVPPRARWCSACAGPATRDPWGAQHHWNPSAAMAAGEIGGTSDFCFSLLGSSAM
jgi:hypothetical protein